MPTPKLSRTIARLLGNRGSARGKAVKNTVRFDNALDAPSSSTTVTDTEKKLGTSEAPSTFAISTTSIGAVPTASRLLVREYQRGQSLLVKPEHAAILDILAAGYSCTREQAVDRVVQFLLSGSGIWGPRSVEDALDFYCANFYVKG